MTKYLPSAVILREVATDPYGEHELNYLVRPTAKIVNYSGLESRVMVDTNHVDLYCERLGPGLFAEPINALTNIAFVISGVVIWRLARRSHGSNLDIKTLAVLATSIGVGSGLFHTFATPWARALDVIPILVFQLMFVWFYARKGIGWGHIPAGILAAGVLTTSLIARSLPELVSGSLNYLPALLVTLFLGIYHRLSNKPSPLILLIAGGLFSLSLMFRTYDEILCAQFPLGIHFLWHITNAVVLYLCGSSLFVLEKTTCPEAQLTK